MKQTAVYLIFIGIAVFILAFLGTIIKYVVNHPLLGLALLAILVGVALLLYSFYQEGQTSEEEKPLKKVEK